MRGGAIICPADIQASSTGNGRLIFQLKGLLDAGDLDELHTFICANKGLRTDNVVMVDAFVADIKDPALKTKVTLALKGKEGNNNGGIGPLFDELLRGRTPCPTAAVAAAASGVDVPVGPAAAHGVVPPAGVTAGVTVIGAVPGTHDPATGGARRRRRSTKKSSKKVSSKRRSKKGSKKSSKMTGGRRKSRKTASKRTASKKTVSKRSTSKKTAPRRRGSKTRK